MNTSATYHPKEWAQRFGLSRNELASTAFEHSGFPAAAVVAVAVASGAAADVAPVEAYSAETSLAVAETFLAEELRLAASPFLVGAAGSAVPAFAAAGAAGEAGLPVAAVGSAAGAVADADPCGPGSWAAGRPYCPDVRLGCEDIRSSF